MSIFLHDRTPIEAFLRQNPALNIYELGDLDPFFWPYTSWIAAQKNGQVTALILLYSGGDPPVVLAMAEPDAGAVRALLVESLPVLPRRFYAHFSPGVAESLAGQYPLAPHGAYIKMALAHPECLDGIQTEDVSRLSAADLPALERLYAEAYPGNWFDPRMLETGCYYGIRSERRDAIISVAGVHVYSRQYSVAAVGSITTHPAYRGQGLGTRVTARLCQQLRQQVQIIGLNVRADNGPALACYHRLGFERIADYEEWMVG